MLCSVLCCAICLYGYCVRAYVIARERDSLSLIACCFLGGCVVGARALRRSLRVMGRAWQVVCGVLWCWRAWTLAR